MAALALVVSRWEKGSSPPVNSGKQLGHAAAGATASANTIARIRDRARPLLAAIDGLVILC